MAMGTRESGRQGEFWIATAALAAGPGHPFYTKLEAVLTAEGFEAFVAAQCAPYYADTLGRPSIPPGVYFRMLLIGYFERIDSERGIAWRCADSLALRAFLGLAPAAAPPEHSSLSRIRTRLPLEVHAAVFAWVLRVLARRGLLDGKTVGIDATTLEANAALRSIVRRDTGAQYQAFLTALAQASGIATPTRADLARLDRTRPRKGSNAEWTHPHDPDAQIAKMKDGRTHLAHKLEHAVDLSGAGAVLAVTVHGGAVGDTTSLPATLETARETLEALHAEAESKPKSKPTSPPKSTLHATPAQEVVADKGYHSNDMLVDLAADGHRTYIAEPRRGRRRWRNKPEAQRATYANRRRIRGRRGKRLLRRRGELLERPFAHYLAAGGLRRTHLRHHDNLAKRLLVHVAGFNLGLLMRALVGSATPKAYAACAGQARAVLACLRALLARCRPRPRPAARRIRARGWSQAATIRPAHPGAKPTFSTGC